MAKNINKDSRDEKLKAIYKNTHKDFKGIINGSKTIMINRGGAVIVKLTDLTESEIDNLLPKNYYNQ